jgi:hypothetical protein
MLLPCARFLHGEILVQCHNCSVIILYLICVHRNSTRLQRTPRNLLGINQYERGGRQMDSYLHIPESVTYPYPYPYPYHQGGRDRSDGPATPLSASSPPNDSGRVSTASIDDVCVELQPTNEADGGSAGVGLIY